MPLYDIVKQMKLKGSGHKYTPQEIEKIVQKTRPELSLDFNTFTSTNKKAKFIDKDYGEYWVLPKSLLHTPNKSHPKRSNPSRAL